MWTTAWLLSVLDSEIGVDGGIRCEMATVFWTRIGGKGSLKTQNSGVPLPDRDKGQLGNDSTRKKAFRSWLSTGTSLFRQTSSMLQQSWVCFWGSASFLIRKASTGRRIVHASDRPRTARTGRLC